MKSFVAVAFTHKGKLILQRRDHDAPNNPGALGFFGGLVEQNEDADAAIRREIEEETSLKASDLEIKHLFDAEIPIREFGSEAGIDSVYECELSSREFIVKEGKGAEVYSLEELVGRKDVAPYSHVIIDKLVKRK